mgnify:CR=1 FL=1
MFMSLIQTYEHRDKEKFLNWTYQDSELVIGLVGAVGTEQHQIINIISDRLKAYNYETEEIRVSRDVIAKLYKIPETTNEFERISTAMDKGNLARKQTGDNGILALGVAEEILSRREKLGKPRKRVAYIVNSLKHPKEVERLREIYASGFYLFGIYSDEHSRLDYLINNKRIKEEDARKLIKRDMSEEEGHGQQTRDTFQMADFFIHFDRDHYQLVEKSIWRILDLMFAAPYITPTFDEFAMFMAFVSALRSADLSRQVGAVITKNEEIIASGANDIPKFGGGLYWPILDSQTNSIVDKANGRDYVRGYDSNKKEQAKIIEDIAKLLDLDNEKIEKLKKSRIRDITEYGRVVHAEMEAILMCARNHISTRGATIYCTTFPCHNCAKHIIAAGIKEVVYIEPYPKSKAFEFHDDSITSDPTQTNKVLFRPFVGIGPRRFFELFSMSLGAGNEKVRKDSNGNIIKWQPERSNLRLQLVPYSYLEKELVATDIFNKKIGGLNNDKRKDS